MSRKSHVVDSTKLDVSGGLSGPSTSGPYYGNGAYNDDFEGDILEQSGGAAKNETDAMTVHRRKMMRRAANRRSAQLSRARKKSHMQELQNENARLHRLLDIFDCQPDFMFTCTKDGRVTHLSHRLAAYRGINTNEESTHVSHLMRQESVEVLYDYISALNGSYSQVNNGKNFFDSNQRDDMVKEVYMLEDANTQRYSVGYMRVSRVNRKPSALVDADVYTPGDAGTSTATMSSSTKESVRTGNRSSPSKRQKRDLDNSLISAKSLEDAAAALSALTGMANGTMGSSRNPDDDDESASATSGVSATEANVNDMAGTFANSTDIYSSRDNSPRGGIAGGDSRASLSVSSSANVSLSGLADVGERYSGTRRRAGASVRSQAASTTTSATGTVDLCEDAGYIGMAGTGGGSTLDAGGSFFTNDEEYVVVVRPADMSMPAQPVRNAAQFGPSLSKASMVKHNSQVKIEGALGRKRSPSGGSSSGNSGDMAFENTSHSSSSSGPQGGTSSGFTSKQSNSSGTNSNTNSDDGVPDNSSYEDEGK